MDRGHAATTAPLAGLLISLLLGGCSGTAFGDRLAGSFSAAPATPPAPARPATAASQPTTASGAKPAQQPPAGTTPTTKTTPKPSPAVAMEPAPYRITIKLPSGDPSAPAEVVTQALRAAGVAFEVEMIERVSSTAPAAAPLPAPQPAPAPRPR